MNERILANQENSPISLEDLLQELEQENVKPLSVAEIKDQIDKTGRAILTRDYLSGIRLTKKRGLNGEDEYIVSTTNSLEDSDNPIAIKFRFRKVQRFNKSNRDLSKPNKDYFLPYLY